MHHPHMLHARTRVSLAIGASLAALMALAALPHPAFADGGLPTPLPNAVSGPTAQSLVGIAQAYGLTCDMYAGSNGDEWFCTRATGQVFYTAEFVAGSP